MYLTSLKVKDLRVLKKVSLDFQYPGRPTASSALVLPNVNLLLGGNGQGKTTVLRAIALAALAPIVHDLGYVPYSMVRRDPVGAKRPPPTQAVVEADFLLHEQDVARQAGTVERACKVVIERRLDLERVLHDPSRADDPVWAAMYDNRAPAFLVVGYGATRRVEDPENYDAASRKRAVLRYQRVAGLFQESFSLIPLERWLPRLKRRNPGRFTQVVHLVDRLLEEPFRFDGRFERGEYHFRQGKSLVPRGGLSDGYRAYLGWITDLLYHVVTGCPKGKKLVETKGIVLVDEVDLHLHPSWQRTVVPTLAKAFPHLQFVLTTHSPIVTGSLEAANVWLLKRRGSSSIATRLPQSVHGLNADQVLVSDYFGLETSRAPGMRQALRDLSLRALKGDRGASLEVLVRLTRGLEGVSIAPNRKRPRNRK